jgi:hypothetical protein
VVEDVHQLVMDIHADQHDVHVALSGRSGRFSSILHDIAQDIHAAGLNAPPHATGTLFSGRFAASRLITNSIAFIGDPYGVLRLNLDWAGLNAAAYKSAGSRRASESVSSVRIDRVERG